MGVKEGYQQTEFGTFPADWDLVPVGDLFTFKNGLNKAKQFFGHGTPIVNYMDVYNHPALRVSMIEGKVDVTPKEQQAYEVLKGDVFFTRTSETVDEIGTASVMLDETDSTVFSGFVLRARPTDISLEDQFKAYCFQPKYFRDQVISRSSYTTRALTNGKSLSAATLARPPKPEQIAIADVLYDIDKTLSEIDKMIAKKRDVKVAAAQQLLTKERRLKGFDSPWRKEKVGKLVKIRNEKTVTLHMEIAKFCVELDSIGKGTAQLNSHSDASNRLSSLYSFKAGDVLFGRLRPYLRKYWYATNDGVCSTEIWPLIPSADEIVPEYLFHTVRTEGFINAASSSYGTHMPRSDWGALVEFEIEIPISLDEQREISKVLSDMDGEISSLQHRRDKVFDLKSAVAHELLNGKTRLPVERTIDD